MWYLIVSIPDPCCLSYFNTSSRYLDDILSINYVYFDNMVSQIYLSELQRNKANTSDTDVAFFNLHLSISNDTKFMASIPLNSFVLLEHLAMLLTSTLAIDLIFNSETS